MRSLSSSLFILTKLVVPRTSEGFNGDYRDKNETKTLIFVNKVSERTQRLI